MFMLMFCNKALEVNDTAVSIKVSINHLSYKNVFNLKCCI